MEFVNGSGNDSNSNMEFKQSMEIVKTDNMAKKSTDNADAVAEVQNLVVRINNLFRNGADINYHPEYYVDLLGHEAVQRYGRGRLEQAARQVTQADEPLAELSTKFTALLKKFNELYFDDDPRLRDVRVEVRYWVGWPPIITTGGGEISLVASCEAVLVRQLLAAMAFYIDQEPDPCNLNEMYLYDAGAPIFFEPKMRHLSAKEFIAAATREPEPTITEEWLSKLRESRPADGAGPSDVIYLWRGGRS
jgi:hypothetical protein